EIYLVTFFFQAEDGIRDFHVTGVQTCALPISVSGQYGAGNITTCHGATNRGCLTHLRRCSTRLCGAPVLLGGRGRMPDDDATWWTSAMYRQTRSFASSSNSVVRWLRCVGCVTGSPGGSRHQPRFTRRSRPMPPRAGCNSTWHARSTPPCS